MWRNEVSDLREAYVRALREHTNARADIAKLLLEGRDLAEADRQRAEDTRAKLETARSAYMDLFGVRHQRPN